MWLIRIVLLIGSALLLLMLGARQTGILLRSPLLALIATYDGTRDVFLIDSRTGIALNLTRDVFDEWTLAVAPTGDRVLFGSGDPRLPAGESVFVLDWRQQQRWMVPTGTTLRIFGLGFSPDGEQVSFFSSHPRNISDLYRTVLEDGSIHNLTNTPELSEENPLWSPDGNLMLFTICDDLYLLDLRSGERSRLTASAAPEEYPLWSPDSRQITYQRVEGRFFARRVQLVFDLNEGERPLQLDREVRAGAATWSPDSKLLAMVSAEGGIMIVDPINQETQVLAVEGYAPVWSPDGRWIAVLSQRNVLLIALDGSGAVALQPEWTAFPPLFWLR